ncbi:MAG: hypothetical protein MI919_05810 [Holophagales bacterium]|nr:hypothetical protein [Holophagales bacterium]
MLSNEEIETILSSRIQLPQRSHLTILRLGRSDELLAWAFADGPEKPLAPLLQHARLRQVSWLPSLLVAPEAPQPSSGQDEGFFESLLDSRHSGRDDTCSPR